MTSVILVDLFGIRKLNSAFGMVTMCEGVGLLIGPPIQGTVKSALKGPSIYSKPLSTKDSLIFPSLNSAYHFNLYIKGKLLIRFP